MNIIFVYVIWLSPRSRAGMLCNVIFKLSNTRNRYDLHMQHLNSSLIYFLSVDRFRSLEGEQGGWLWPNQPSLFTPLAFVIQKDSVVVSFAVV